MNSSESHALCAGRADRTKTPRELIGPLSSRHTKNGRAVCHVSSHNGSSSDCRARPDDDAGQQRRARADRRTLSNPRPAELTVQWPQWRVVVSGRDTRGNKRPVFDAAVSRDVRVIHDLDFISYSDVIVQRDTSRDDAPMTDPSPFSNRCSITDQRMVTDLDVVIDGGVGANRTVRTNGHTTGELHFPRCRSRPTRRSAQHRTRKDNDPSPQLDAGGDHRVRMNDAPVGEGRPLLDDDMRCNVATGTHDGPSRDNGERPDVSALADGTRDPRRGTDSTVIHRHGAYRRWNSGTLAGGSR
jgi:hypothetical protein